MRNNRRVLIGINTHIEHREAKMRNINWFATTAAGALILAGMGVVWTTSSTQVVAAPKLNQIEPFQIMTKAKDLPDQTFEDRTFVCYLI
jgi:hypothetical protein